ncbi:MAG: VOC family protein [Candidatus Bathyarchaeia archaeon]
MAKLDHIGLYVKDLSRSREFYEQLFGFEERHSFRSGEAEIVALDVGSALLELIQRPGSPGVPPEGNWSHLALRVDEYETVREKLYSMGLDTRDVELDDGSRISFFKDPDGHTVEVMEKGLGV